MPEEQSEAHPQFSVESLNKEVMTNLQRTKRAGDLLKDVYKTVRNVEKGIENWIVDEVGKEDLKVGGELEESFVLSQIKKNGD